MGRRRCIVSSTSTFRSRMLRAIGILCNAKCSYHLW